MWGFRRVLERTYGYRCVYRKILLDGKCVGVFPSVAVARGSGRLVSQPFNEYGGPLTEGLSNAQHAELARLLLHLAEQENCLSVEIRGGIGCEPMAQTDSCRRHRLHSFAILQLDEKEQLWRTSLTNEARKAIKQAQNAGLQVEILRGHGAIADPFFQLYLVSMKRLGVPPHPVEFLTSLAAELGERLVTAAVRHRNERVSYLLGAVTGKRLQIFITASEPSAWAWRPNDLAHWELINWAFAAGLQVFDLGSARYPGQTHFKKKWGATFHDYSYYLISAPNSTATRAVQTADPSSKLMTAAAAVWRWVVPLRLTPVLGPPIRRYLTK